MMPNGQPHKFCPACYQPAVMDMPVCRRCGYRYPLGPNSAYPQPPGRYESPSPALYQARRDGRTLVVIIGLLLLALFLGGGWVVMRATSHSQKQTGLQMAQGPGGLLSAAGIPKEQIDQRLLTAGAATGGDLEVSLAWNSYTDLDLQVGEPTGEKVDAEHRRSSSGGEQDVDANPTPLTPEGSMRAASGQVPGAENVLPLTPEMIQERQQSEPSRAILRQLQDITNHAPSLYTTTPVEHIYYAKASRGVYTVYVSCYSWREQGTTPLPFTIEIRSKGRVIYTGSGQIGPSNYCANGAPPIAVYQFNSH